MQINKKLEHSVLDENWQIREFDEKLISQISQYFNFSDVTSKLISSRVESLTEAKDYVNPKIKNLLPNPFDLLDMDKAVTRTIFAIKNQEKIHILADYDVDGATSAALLKNIFRLLKINSKIYIPQRDEGYGPNVKALEKIAYESNLLISVDCGSSAIEEFEYAEKLGLDSIILDHHITSNKLPKVLAIVNPNRYDEKTDYKNLAAVGVSFLFLVALISKLKVQKFFDEKNIVIPNLIEQLDIVALGTICDVVKLDLLNRALVKQGLLVSTQSKNVGYKTLCRLSLSNMEKIDSSDLSFLLGPQINAGGRIGNSSIGSELLSTESYKEASELAQELFDLNKSRQNIENEVLQEALLKAETQKNDPLILVVGENWHKGVIGIISARLKEKYSKLAIVISIQENIGTASCRSVKHINISEKILNAKSQNLLIKGGGHKMAAGFSIHRNMINKFHNFLKDSVQSDLATYKKEIRFYDMHLRVSSITERFIRAILELEPHGVGNPEPIFKISDFYIVETKILKNSHISLVLKDSILTKASHVLYAIAFNVLKTPIAEFLLKYNESLRYSILGRIKFRKWNNREFIQIYIQDLLVE